MRKLKYSALLFTIIFIEGYVVLASELLAIRQAIPFIGTGTDVVSIIIAAVLMPLALGYQVGGEFKPHRFMGIFITARKKLIANMAIAATILTLGFSYRFLFSFFYILIQAGVQDRITQTFFYCILFLIVPIFLLGQTVPLITRFFPKDTLPKVTGKILFISTVGSFFGAIFSTFFLMSLMEIQHTVTLNFLLLTILIILLSKHKGSATIKTMTTLFLIFLTLNSNIIIGSLLVVKNNRYAAIAVSHDNGYNQLHINHNYDSKYNPETKRKHNYIEFAEEIAIKPIMNSDDPPKEILIIGAGGFTFGHDDKKNHYTYVDIDPDLKKIAEEEILKEPIGDNKQFIPEEARGYLRFSKKKFDMIYLDAYLGAISIPEQLVTKEFYTQVKDALNDKGIMIVNLIVSPNFGNVFSKSLDNTLQSVFPHLSRVAINDTYDVWNESETSIGNVAYIYKNHIEDKTMDIFVDHPASQDK